MLQAITAGLIAGVLGIVGVMWAGHEQRRQDRQIALWQQDSAAGINPPPGIVRRLARKAWFQRALLVGSMVGAFVWTLVDYKSPSPRSAIGLAVAWGALFGGMLGFYSALWIIGEHAKQQDEINERIVDMLVALRTDVREIQRHVWGEN